MKKLILSLVLATLTLSAMALTTDQQTKLDNAWSVLTAHGVDPTVMKNELNFDFNSTKYNQGVYDQNIINFGNAFTNTNNIARQGKDSFFNVNGGVVTTSNNGKKVELYRNNVNYYYKKSTNTYATKKLSHMNSYYFKYYGNKAYNYLKAVDPTIITLSDKISDADISGDVGSAIQGEVEGLKATIRNIGILEVVAELAKSVESTCINDKATNACTALGVQFISLDSNIETLNPVEHYIYQSDIWLVSEDGNTVINQTTGATENTNYFSSWTGIVYQPEVLSIDTYENSLFEISNIANAFAEISNSNATFGNLTDL